MRVKSFMYLENPNENIKVCLILFSSLPLIIFHQERACLFCCFFHFFFSREHLDHSPAYRMITRQQIIDKLCAEQHWQSQCCFRTEQLSEQLSFLPRVSCHCGNVGLFLPDRLYLEEEKSSDVLFVREVYCEPYLKALFQY